MALYRAFSVGRFKCSKTVPKLSAVTEYPSEGYALVIRKDSTKTFCLGCIKSFFMNKGLLISESKNYLTVRAP
jgi:hypothetical protein